MNYMTIGSGTAVPQRERSAPCHLIRGEGRTVVVDLGPGSIWGLARHGRVHLPDVELLLFTHLHMDHCADLAPFLFALRSRELSRTAPLWILGPEGMRDHYGKLQATWEKRVEPAGYELLIDEWAGSAVNWKGWLLDAAPTSHGVPNLAWRIDSEGGGGCGVVLTGDGESTDELIQLARRADHVLVAESAAAPGEVLEGHMNPGQAGDLARQCGSRMLVLCHINPGAGVEAILRESMAFYDGEVVVAEDGMVVEVE
ncbi:MAG: MBL fold metallo-hydrolase [bacterium]|nr:MAG: MBL fold metallo-hydrolase [bacterium]